MAIEIERKFTVINDSWRDQVERSCRFRQGYLAGDKQASVRVRIEGDKANLNIKSATLGIFRKEFEYDIPLVDAIELLDQLCAKPLIEKTRHFLHFGGKEWEIDVFEGDNAGLIVAEVELTDENETVELPPWAGEDVSADVRYYNVSLVKHPYKDWQP